MIVSQKRDVHPATISARDREDINFDPLLSHLRPNIILPDHMDHLKRSTVMMITIIDMPIMILVGRSQSNPALEAFKYI